MKKKNSIYIFSPTLLDLLVLFCISQYQYKFYYQVNISFGQIVVTHVGVIVASTPLKDMESFVQNFFKFNLGSYKMKESSQSSMILLRNLLNSPLQPVFNRPLNRKKKEKENEVNCQVIQSVRRQYAK